MDWNKIRQAYEVVESGVVKRADGENYKIYSLGEKNGTIRIDIKPHTEPNSNYKPYA